MIRNWNGESNNLILSALKLFGIHAESMTLIKYETLSPDSCIWYFTADRIYYCLYTEDFVPSLVHVQKIMMDNVPRLIADDKFELQESIDRISWDEASPVLAASNYPPPERVEEFMNYAATSGIDFVFLGKSTIKN